MRKTATLPRSPNTNYHDMSQCTVRQTSIRNGNYPAYNLVRAIMAQTCSQAGLLPRDISFKAAVQTLEAFQSLIAAQGCRNPTHRMLLYEQILHAIAVHQVGKRPGRLEPRLRKRRTKKYDYMMKPRNETKLEIMKRLTN